MDLDLKSLNKINNLTCIYTSLTSRELVWTIKIVVAYWQAF